ncbi:MAG: hypothetical protein WC449_05530 [Candidatus Paceibacterota bacterium]
MGTRFWMDNKTWQNVPDMDWQKTSATQTYPLGTRMVTDDGRVFRYTKNGATILAAGKVVRRASDEANHELCAVVANHSIGSMVVTVTLGATAATKDMYKEGFMHIATPVASNAHGGYSYRIASHPAAALSANLALTLESGLITALTITTDTVCLKRHAHNAVIIASAGDRTIGFLGVPPTLVAASYYFWLQTRGQTNVLVDTGDANQGVLCTSGATVDGAAGPVTGHTDVPIGYFLEDAGATYYKPFMLMLD